MNRTSNVNEVFSLIDKYFVKLDPVRHKAINFVETINTKYDGRSSEIASRIIDKSFNSNHFFIKKYDQKNNIINYLK